MHFDPENPIVKLCAAGMMAEGEGNRAQALALFMQAWNEAVSELEKSIAAHYVARHQSTLPEQLHWNELALTCALRSKEDAIAAMLPSLYLNAGKDHEDLRDYETARRHYESGLEHAHRLPDDGYGQLVRRGIENGLGRISTL
jgi:rifampin ADP-ribosylating transferase